MQGTVGLADSAHPTVPIPDLWVKTMNGQDLLRIVDLMHREKNIPKEVIFEGIEAALQLAAERAHGGGVAVADEESDEPEVVVTIDRVSGEIKAIKGDQVIDPEDLGRIAAQSAKQVM